MRKTCSFFSLRDLFSQDVYKYREEVEKKYFIFIADWACCAEAAGRSGTESTADSEREEEISSQIETELELEPEPEAEVEPEV